MGPGPALDAVWTRYDGRARLVRFILIPTSFVMGLLVVVIQPAKGSSVGTTGIVVISLIGAVALLLVGLAAVAASDHCSRGLHRLEGLVVDGAGLWWRHSGKMTLVPWMYVAGVGLGTERVRGVSITTLEVFPHPVPLPADLTRHMATGEPLRPGLPTGRLRYPLPRPEDRTRVPGAVQRFAPSLWAGVQQRRGGARTVVGLLGIGWRR